AAVDRHLRSAMARRRPRCGRACARPPRRERSAGESRTRAGCLSPRPGVLCETQANDSHATCRADRPSAGDPAVLTNRTRTDKTAPMSSAREEIEALRTEVRRLRSVVRRLEEEKKDLEERLAFLAMELERTRTKVTAQIRTS